MTPRRSAPRYPWLARIGLATCLSALACHAPPEQRSLSLHSELFDTVWRQLSQPENLPVEGDWPLDLGDAHYYGAGVLHRYASRSSDPGALRRLASEMEQVNRQLLAAKGFALLDNLEARMMAALGLLEAQAHDPADDRLQEVSGFVDQLDLLAAPFDYHPASLGEVSWAIRVYGATTINAVLALLHLELAGQLRGSLREERLKRARKVLAAGKAKGYDESLGAFRIRPDERRLHLYPNVLQGLAYLRLHQLTGEHEQLAFAEGLFPAVEKLRVPEQGRYLSPYSAESFGAISDDFTTLSSQNYTALYLGLLYQQSRKALYRSRARDLLTFIDDKLRWKDGRVLHHWIDGHLADPNHLQSYCSGCNLQLLYVILRLDDALR